MRHIIKTRFPEDNSLLTLVYNSAFFTREQRKHYKRGGETSEWALDMRLPLSKGDYLRPIAQRFADEMRERGICQVVGRGYGSFPLIGAIISLGGCFAGAFIRNERKGYGYREQIEGSINPTEPVMVVDDFISSGNSMTHTMKILKDAYLCPTVVATVFKTDRHFDFGVDIFALADLKLA